jgi:DNA primase
VGIIDEDVARVRAATDFVALASEHMALKKSGRNWQGLCPFHPEKTPSFNINAEEGLYYCFGCAAKGDVITFVREIEHLEFVEAVERLATRANIQLHYDNERTGADRKNRQRLLDAMEQAVEWYHQRLLTAPDAGKARAYLKSRGYGGDVARAFKLGWAPDDWDELARALSLPEEVLRDSGLGFINRRGRQQDAFRGRIMFPIFDAGGHCVAFGGRILPGGEGPKYKNSPETPIYSKRRVLYGLNWAKTDIVERGETVVCEGYTDVIGFFQAGIPRAVATCGTALADEHVRLLKNFAPKVILAYDADAAGQAAAERFYEWEQKEKIDIAVAALPPGADPGDVAAKDPEALKAAVEGARPFLAFRLERVLGHGDLRSPEGRARAAAEALAVISEHPNEWVRDQYVMEVADRTRIDADRLRAGIGNAKAAVRAPLAARRKDPPPSPEREALLLAVLRPGEVAHRLEDVLFVDDVNVAAYQALVGAATLHEAIEAATPEAAALLMRLAVEETTAEPDDVMALLVRAAAHRVIAELEAEARATGSLEFAPTIGWLKQGIADLDEPSTRVEAESRLLPWLVVRGETVEAIDE